MASEYDPCPECGSTDIREEAADCLCHRLPGRTCWSTAACNACGFTLGRRAANSQGGGWFDFVSGVQYEWPKPKAGFLMTADERVSK